MTSSGVCKRCGDPIDFFKTRNGKWMPVEVSADPDGNVLVDFGAGTVSVLAGFELLAARADPDVKLRKSHFVVCSSRPQVEPDDDVDGLPSRSVMAFRHGYGAWEDLAIQVVAAYADGRLIDRESVDDIAAAWDYHKPSMDVDGQAMIHKGTRLAVLLNALTEENTG